MYSIVAQFRFRNKYLSRVGDLNPWLAYYKYATLTGLS